MGGSQTKELSTDWTKKKLMLDKIIEQYRGEYEYDCIIPFSGREDSVMPYIILSNTLYRVSCPDVQQNSYFWRNTRQQLRMGCVVAKVRRTCTWTTPCKRIPGEEAILNSAINQLFETN